MDWEGATWATLEVWGYITFHVLVAACVAWFMGLYVIRRK